MEIVGTLHKIFDERRITDNFTIREFVVKVDDGQYTQEILCQCVNKKVDLIIGFKPGERVAVSINLRGKEKNGKWYNQIEAWKIERE